MAINRTPVLKRCRQLGIDPVVLGYSSKKESIRQPKRRRKESEYAMQLREKQKAKFIYGVLEKQWKRAWTTWSSAWASPAPARRPARWCPMGTSA